MSRLFHALLLLPAFLPACGADSERVVHETRDLKPEDVRFKWGADSNERFGRRRAPTNGGGGKPERIFTYETPEGWQQLPGRQFRNLNFRVAGHPRAECYLTILGGDGGGLLANVNRWRVDQMGLEPVGAAEVADLPRRPMLGTDAVHVALHGAFRGGGEAPKDDWAMHVLMAQQGGSAIFLKMIGPAEVVDGEVAAFRELAESLDFSEEAKAMARQATEGEASGESGRYADGSRRLAWDRPAGWTRGSEHRMRLATFTAGEDTECTLSAFQGGGDLLANANRWRGQLGARPLDAGDLAGSERIEILGTEAVVVRAEGTYRGMGTEQEEGYALLGAIVDLGAEKLFVKMIGPAAEVAAEEDAFMAFCRSLREET